MGISRYNKVRMSDGWTVVAFSVGRREEAVPQIDQRYARFRLTVAESRIQGWGVYAEEPIPARRKVIEYTGQHLTTAQSDELLHRPQHYLFHVSDDLIVDGATNGSGAQYINHSCAPNLRIWLYHRHILLMSLRAIAPGEELSYDYRFRPSVLQNVCRCGAPNCRGSINPVLK